MEVAIYFQPIEAAFHPSSLPASAVCCEPDALFHTRLGQPTPPRSWRIPTRRTSLSLTAPQLYGVCVHMSPLGLAWSAPMNQTRRCQHCKIFRSGSFRRTLSRGCVEMSRSSRSKSKTAPGLDINLVQQPKRHQFSRIFHLRWKRCCLYAPRARRTWMRCMQHPYPSLRRNCSGKSS